MNWDPSVVYSGRLETKKKRGRERYTEKKERKYRMRNGKIKLEIES